MNKKIFLFTTVFTTILSMNIYSGAAEINQPLEANLTPASSENHTILKLTAGLKKTRKMELNVSVLNNSKPTMLSLISEVSYQVVSIDENGNYLISASPLSIKADYKNDQEIKKIDSSKISAPDISEESFMMVVSPYGQILSLQKEGTLQKEIQMLLAYSTLKNCEPEEVAVFIIPTLTDLICTNLFHFPQAPISPGQSWESNAMVSPSWRTLAGPVFLVKNIETSNMGKITKEGKSIKVDSKQVFAADPSAAKLLLSVGTGKVQIDLNTNWVEKANGSWWVTAHVLVDDKGNREGLSKKEFFVRANINIE